MRGSRCFSRLRRAMVYIRDGFACRYCARPVSLEAALDAGRDPRRGPTGDAATIDHVDPSREGPALHALDNLVTCCADCNAAKGAAKWDPGPHRGCADIAAARALRARYWPGQV